jgi:hypothetical protein
MADERTNERIAPVALPAGQFELTKLHAALETATSGKDREQHPERIAKAIVDTIHNPELLAALNAPAVPTGAELVDQGVVYAEGSDPVTRPVVAFTQVKAKNGTEASHMRYEDDAPLTLSEQAAERVADETDTASSKAGAKGK